MEANGPKPSELTKVSAAVGQLPIPGAKIASFAADTVLGAIAVADKKAWAEREDELSRRTDEEEEALKSEAYTAQLDKLNREKNQGTVFGAEGGKLSPKYYMVNRKLNIGGVAPMKPEATQNPLQQITRGDATKTQGVRNNQQGLMDYAIDSIPGIVTFAQDAVAQNKDKKATEAQEQEKKDMESASSTANVPVQPANPGGRSGGLGGSGGGMGGKLGSGFGSGMGGTAGAGGPESGMEMEMIKKVAMAAMGAPPMEKGGKITGKGDGTGKDDKIEIESDGGYVIPVETLADKNKMNEVKSVVGHSDNEVASLNKTSGGGNAKVSSEEYYLTAPESEAVAAHYAAKGSDIDDELAPNTKYPMTEAADGGLLGRIRQFLGKKTAEGFLQKDYENVVHDYRGNVPQGTTYDQTDQTSIPTFQDWYDTHSGYASGDKTGNPVMFSKKGFDRGDIGLGDVAGEYDAWMKKNREDAYNDFTQNNTDKTNTTTSGTSTAGSNDDIVTDFQNWNKDFQSLYNKLTIADIAKDAALTYYNNEQTRKFPEPNPLTQGHYPIPSLAGQKNKLDQKLGLINTLTTRQKTSDLASNMALHASGTVAKLSEQRTGTADMFDKIEAAKVDKHKEEIAIKEKNLANEQRYDQLDAYLTNDFLKQKGQAIGQGLDNITDNLKSNLDTQVKNKTAEITLRSALEQQRMFEAGGQYTSLSTELGQFFPQQWLSQQGMAEFMDMDPAERDAIIQEARRQKAAYDNAQGSPPVITNPPVNPQGDENDPGESNND